MDFLMLSIHLLIYLFAVCAWYFWEEDFGFRINLKPRLAMKYMFLCYNAGSQKSVKRPFREANAAHLKCVEQGFWLKDKKNGHITTTLHSCDLLYCGHICLLSPPLNIHLPPPHTVSWFLFWNYLSSMSMVRVFWLPTIEAKEAPSRNFLFQCSPGWTGGSRPANQILSPRTLNCERDSQMERWSKGGGPRSVCCVRSCLVPDLCSCLILQLSHKFWRLLNIPLVNLLFAFASQTTVAKQFVSCHQRTLSDRAWVSHSPDRSGEHVSPSHFTYWELWVQRGWMTCPKSHSK